MSVLESIEKLPVYLYDACGGSTNGLQTLTRRLRFRLERSPGETGLTDRTGRTLKMEPLTTIGQVAHSSLCHFIAQIGTDACCSKTRRLG